MKKCISLLVAFCLMLSCAVPVFAADAAAEPCNCGKTPIIVVSGMGALPFLIDEGTAQERQAFPPKVDIAPLVLRGLGAVVMSVFTWNIRYFADAAADIALEILGVLALDENAKSIVDITPVRYDKPMSGYDPALYTDAETSEFSIVNAAVRTVGADHAYFYNYDWRLDPMANAADLDAFITRVLRETGHSKVRIAAISMGGVQTMAYMQQYGSDKIDTVWFLSAAWHGLLFVTNVFTGELIISQKSFFCWLQTLEVGNEKTDAVFDRLMGRCAETKLLRPMFSLINKLNNLLNDAAVYGVMQKTLGTTAGMWAFVRDDRYEEAKKVMLPEGRDAFEKIIDNYHYNVLNRRAEIIAEAQANGVQFAVLSHYNNGCVPVTSSALAHGDNLIETVCTSGGAVVADFGSTLPQGYVQKAHSEHDHLSADGVIDASTCLLPDNTWFIKNMPHVGCKKGSAYFDMLVWLFSSDDVPTVFDNAQYPQFLQTDAKTQMTLKPCEVK